VFGGNKALAYLLRRNNFDFKTSWQVEQGVEFIETCSFISPAGHLSQKESCSFK
jgi:hypothetical protein